MLEALQRGKLIEAVKLLRASGIDLKQAKDAIDAYLRRAAQHPAQPDAQPEAPPAAGFKDPRASKDVKYAKDDYESMNASGLSPGQVPDSGNAVWWAVVLALVFFLGYLLLRRFA